MPYSEKDTFYFYLYTYIFVGCNSLIQFVYPVSDLPELPGQPGLLHPVCGQVPEGRVSAQPGGAPLRYEPVVRGQSLVEKLLVFNF